MHEIIILSGILAALLLGAMSPGPSFVMVSRIAVTKSRSDGLRAALGMGVGGALFASLALAGLASLLSAAGWLYLVFKLAGGAYLIYLGVKIWQHAPQRFDIETSDKAKQASRPRSFSLAMLTQISNPKTAIVYASIFASLLPANPPLWMLLVLPPLVFIIEAGWYMIVAVVFSGPHATRVYLRSKTWIDRFTGLVLGALGLRLISDGFRP